MKNYKYILRLQLQSGNLKLLKAFILYIQKTFKIINIFNLPTQIKKLTVLKSPHGHKKSREQFQFKKHNKLITLNFVSKTEFLKLRYTLLNIIPASITLKILFKKINS